MSYLDRRKSADSKQANLLQIEEKGGKDDTRILYTGELDIPLVLEDQIEVFVESEKLYSN